MDGLVIESLFSPARSLKSDLGHEYVVFCINGRFFGIEAREVIEVVREPRLQFLPMAQRSVVGVIDFRGDILTAVDVEALLSGKEENERKQRTEQLGLVVKAKDRQTLFLIPEVTGLFVIYSSQIGTGHDSFAKVSAPGVAGAAARTPLNDSEKEETVILLDPEKLVSELVSESKQESQGGKNVASFSASLPAPTEEEIESFELMGESFLDRHERLRQMDLNDFLCFRVDELGLGIQITTVSCVVRSHDVQKAEDLGDTMLGWIEYRDSQVPVADIRRTILPNRKTPLADNYHVIVIESGHTIVLEVDQVQGVIKGSLVGESEMATLPKVLRETAELFPVLIDSVANPVLGSEMSPFAVVSVAGLLGLLLEDENLRRIAASPQNEESEGQKQEKEREAGGKPYDNCDNSG
jgi:chemotaxis signal transduction protein